MAIPQVPEERAQGAVQAQEQLEAMAPAPLEPTPTQADASALDIPNMGIAIPSEGIPPSGTAQPRQPNMWRIPTSYQKVLGEEHKNPVQQREDIGRLWEALAYDPRVSPIVRQIANNLLGRA